MGDTHLPDGTVISSSQLLPRAVEKNRRLYSPMIGVVLSVQPSDHKDNFASGNVEDRRGWRNECTVLITDNNSEPNLVLEHVVIPPSSPSGFDNFHENLPRGVDQTLLTGKTLPEHFSGISFTDLDCEWCIVNFIGGSIDRPFIQNWWYHPRNTIDPATSDSSQSGFQTLEQVDLKKNRFRYIKRINGVNAVVNTKGDVYLNTCEASRKIKIGDKSIAQKSQYDKGGNVQIDVKHSKQLELNFNLPVEGLASGSNSQSYSRDPSLPHIKQDLGKPKARETTRTFFRLKEYETLLKSSNSTVYCKTEGNNNGQFTVLADNAVSLMQGEETTAVLSMYDGTIQLVSENGDVLTVGKDEVKMATKSGATVSLNAGGTISVIGSSIAMSAPVGIGGATAESVVLWSKFDASLEVFVGAMTTALNAYKSSILPPDPASNKLVIIGLTEAILALFNLRSFWKSKGLTTV